VRDELSAQGAPGSIEVVHLDLASLASVRAAAVEIKRKTKKVDVLLNNAGSFNMKRRLTEDGFEMTMGVNHLGHFLFTHELIPLLANAGAARIINLASDAHLHGKLKLDDLFMEKRYAGFRAYAASRLATVLFTQELAERLLDQGITANSLHPGHVATNIWSLWPKLKPLNNILLKIMARFLLTAEEGAETSLYLACSEDVAGETGRYYDKCLPADVNPICSDRGLRRRLWDVSSELTGTGYQL
jgi:NAD(P)-dependent dehydrogenase (short-subunit alcohol dehydrogenase family)